MRKIGRANEFVAKLLSLVFVTACVVAAQSAPSRKGIPAIVKAANGAVVSIIMSDRGKPIAQGSGFLVSKNGVIVTNYHVIAEGNSAVIKLPDGAFFAVDGVLASDKARDIAVIKAHGTNFRTLTLGNSNRVQVGEEVVAIGNPLSLESTVSNGIVSGIRTDEKLGGKFLQVTAPISPGSSGGPLFNMAGEVVGITTLYLKGGENLNFAIPSNDVRRLLRNHSAGLQNLPNEVVPENTPKETHDVQATLSQLKACNEQAEKYARYEVQHYRASEAPPPLLVKYVNHYDPTANKCFVEIFEDWGISEIPSPTVPGEWIKGWNKSYSIGDAFAEATGDPFYGGCGSIGQRVMECYIYPDGSSTSNIRCRSVEEFTDLVRKLFGTAIIN